MHYIGKKTARNLSEINKNKDSINKNILNNSSEKT